MFLRRMQMILIIIILLFALEGGAVRVAKIYAYLHRYLSRCLSRHFLYIHTQFVKQSAVRCAVCGVGCALFSLTDCLAVCHIYGPSVLCTWWIVDLSKTNCKCCRFWLIDACGACVSAICFCRLHQICIPMHAIRSVFVF